MKKFLIILTLIFSCSFCFADFPKERIYKIGNYFGFEEYHAKVEGDNDISVEYFISSIQRFDKDNFYVTFTGVVTEHTEFVEKVYTIPITLKLHKNSLIKLAIFSDVGYQTFVSDIDENTIITPNR